MVEFVHKAIAFFIAIETLHILLTIDELSIHQVIQLLRLSDKSWTSSAVRIPGTKAMNHTVFDQCILKSNPVWTEELKHLLDPDYDPLKNEFNDTQCKARAILHNTEFHHALGEWHRIEEKFVFENDIVEVQCMRYGEVAYQFIHSQIWTGERRNQATIAKNITHDSTVKLPSIYIMVMDSFGASHAKRVFPKTLEFLKKELHSIEMHHLNKVGGSSQPNAFSFLFGQSIQEVNRDQWGLPNIYADLNHTQFCDEFLNDENFFLKTVEKNGYKTMMAEDWPEGVFNFPNCKGFKTPPAKHYMRPFQLALKEGTSARYLRNHQGKKNCFEDHQFLNQYMQQFIEAYPDSPKLALYWDASVGHDDPNDPFRSDKDYEEFFKQNREELDNSFFFFMADHGFGYGKMRETPEGRRDANNPMMHVTIPRRLRSIKPLMKNLKENSNKLLTMFDVHATFLDIIETFTSSAVSDFTKIIKKPHLRGSSMLRPLPRGDRNCKTLPIPFHACLCHWELQPVQITDSMFGVARAIADAIDEQLKKFDIKNLCTKLEPDEVTKLELVKGTDDLYKATVRFKPNNGIYSTFVRGSRGIFDIVAPDINRLDRYGDQSKCVDIHEIKPLCYCEKNAFNRILDKIFA